MPHLWKTSRRSCPWALSRDHAESFVVVPEAVASLALHTFEPPVNHIRRPVTSGLPRVRRTARRQFFGPARYRVGLSGRCADRCQQDGCMAVTQYINRPNCPTWGASPRRPALVCARMGQPAGGAHVACGFCWRRACAGSTVSCPCGHHCTRRFRCSTGGLMSDFAHGLYRAMFVGRLPTAMRGGASQGRKRVLILRLLEWWCAAFCCMWRYCVAQRFHRPMCDTLHPLLVLCLVRHCFPLKYLCNNFSVKPAMGSWAGVRQVCASTSKHLRPPVDPTPRTCARERATTRSTAGPPQGAPRLWRSRFVRSSSASCRSSAL